MLNEAINDIHKCGIIGCSFNEYLSFISTRLGPTDAYLADMTGQPAYARMILHKIANLLVAKYQYSHRHETLLAKPFGLLVDPSNSCHLRCPGCIHNDYLRRHDEVDWPEGFLSLDTFAKFLSHFGPTALHLCFFNWGEPLLNRDTPRFIEMAKNYMLLTELSSNLSVRFDAEALVRSGLDFLTISIDGATPESYGRYRKGGNFELVLENVRKLVLAKKTLNSSTPILNWQYLTFEHNVVEIPLARLMAEEIGVDQINFGQPYDVSWGDPTISVSNRLPEKISFPIPNGRKNIGQLAISNQVMNGLPPIGGYFAEKQLLVPEIAPSRQTTTGGTCHWLYKAMVMDAHGRYLPCCYAPKKHTEFRYIFSNAHDDLSGNAFNDPCYRVARKHFTAPESACEDACRPFCLVCNDPNQTRPNISNEQIGYYFNHYYLGGLDIPPYLSKNSIQVLQEWEDPC